MVLVIMGTLGIILVVSGGGDLWYILAVVTDILLCSCGFNISPGNVWQVYGIAADFLKL